MGNRDHLDARGNVIHISPDVVRESLLVASNGCMILLGVPKHMKFGLEQSFKLASGSLESKLALISRVQKLVWIDARDIKPGYY